MIFWKTQPGSVEEVNYSTELLIRQAIARGYTEIEAEILVDRFNYIREQFGFARAYQMFIERLIG